MTPAASLFIEIKRLRIFHHRMQPMPCNSVRSVYTAFRIDEDRGNS